MPPRSRTSGTARATAASNDVIADADRDRLDVMTDSQLVTEVDLRCQCVERGVAEQHGEPMAEDVLGHAWSIDRELTRALAEVEKRRQNGRWSG
jgi:hypothetical protein